jgi:anti-sigma factor RsiW
LDVVKRDRFELLSAYLDGEVTPEERRWVSSWLQTDPEAQCLYRRLLMLRNGFQRLPIQPSTEAAEVTVNSVMHRLHSRSQVAYLAGSSAIAAVFLGVLSNLIGPQSSMLQLADISLPSGASQSPSLSIAVDRPVIEIPKAAMVSDVTVEEVN